VLVAFQALGFALALYVFVVFIAPKGAGPGGWTGYLAGVVVVDVLFVLWLMSMFRELQASFAR